MFIKGLSSIGAITKLASLASIISSTDVELFTQEFKPSHTLIPQVPFPD